jgi:hypothetical protein
MLFAMFIDTEALKVNVPSGPELRLYGARDVNGTLHVELFHATLHDAEFDGDDSSHFDCAAEGYLAVAL